MVFIKFIRKFILLAQEMRGKKFPRGGGVSVSNIELGRVWLPACIKDLRNLSCIICWVQTIQNSGIHNICPNVGLIQIQRQSLCSLHVSKEICEKTGLKAKYLCRLVSAIKLSLEVFPECRADVLCSSHPTRCVQLCPGVSLCLCPHLRSQLEQL